MCWIWWSNGIVIKGNVWVWIELVNIGRLGIGYCDGKVFSSDLAINGCCLFVIFVGWITVRWDTFVAGGILFLMGLGSGGLSCLTSISISLLWRISARDIGIEPVKLVDFIIELLFVSGKVVVTTELVGVAFEAKKKSIKENEYRFYHNLALKYLF